MKSIYNSDYRNLFLGGLLIFLITAFFSEGYYHPDEHFQILEFCNYKLGKTPVSDLAWEFHETIRPTLQIGLATVCIKLFQFFNINNPFIFSLLLRIFTSVLVWYIVSKSCLMLLKDFTNEKGKKIFICLNFFLWFVSTISVRFSSENYSSILFLSAVYLIINNLNSVDQRRILKFIIAGILLACSFFMRFQIGFAIIGLGAWILIFARLEWKLILAMILSGMVAILFCVYIDFWFYGKWVFTPYHYFHANIIENKAANWGVTPWWQYFKLFVLQGIPPISIVLLLFFVSGCYRNSKHVFVWCLIPFLVGHFLVGHKEMRFLFPMVFYFIYLASIGIDRFIESGDYYKLTRVLYIMVLTFNMPLLIGKMVMPAQEAIPYLKFLYEFSEKQEMTLLCKNSSIYRLSNLNMHFYNSPNLNTLVFNSDVDISDYLKKNRPDSVFLLNREINENRQYDGYNVEKGFCLFPEWLLHFNFNNWQNRSRIWNIVILKKQPETPY